MQNCNRNQYQDSPVVLPGIRRVQIDADSLSTPTIVNVPVALASTELSYALPAGTKKFEIRSREGATLKLAYTSGESGTTYRTIPMGCAYWEQGLDSATSFTLYFQSTKAGSTVEIVSWA